MKSSTNSPTCPLIKKGLCGLAPTVGPWAQSPDLLPFSVSSRKRLITCEAPSGHSHVQFPGLVESFLRQWLNSALTAPCSLQSPFHWKHFSSERKAFPKYETEKSVRRRGPHYPPHLSAPQIRLHVPEAEG